MKRVFGLDDAMALISLLPLGPLPEWRTRKLPKSHSILVCVPRGWEEFLWIKAYVNARGSFCWSSGPQRPGLHRTIAARNSRDFLLLLAVLAIIRRCSSML